MSSIAYNSCRNRHCPKCQGQTARAWLAERAGRTAARGLLPRGLHAAGADRRDRVPEQGRGLRPAVPHRRRDAADDRRRSEASGRPDRAHAVLHTWGSALTHHPHVHVIVPGGGFAPDGSRWIACRPGFFLPVRVLSRLFRGSSWTGSMPRIAPANSPSSATRRRWPTRRLRGLSRAAAPAEWVVYAKRPFAGPEAVLAYLSRYTHRVAISNSRLLALDERGVTLPLEGLPRPGRRTGGATRP